MRFDIGRRTLSCALLVMSALPARADDWTICKQLSFAPLDFNVPACTRLVDAGQLADNELVTALLARADAYLFARTYRSGHQIDAGQLMAKGLADLDRAITTMRDGPASLIAKLRTALDTRGSLLLELGRAEAAADDYSELLRSVGDGTMAALHGHALAMRHLGRYDEAIADMNALIRVAANTPDYPSWIFKRGEIFEAAGNHKAAIDDYRFVQSLDPKHLGAGRALQRLVVVP
jgi:tetratricopeptide (TPR) repeat protein